MLCLCSVSCRSFGFGPFLLSLWWQRCSFGFINDRLNFFPRLFSRNPFDKGSISCDIMWTTSSHNFWSFHPDNCVGIGEKLVENLFVFFCLTSTVSPTLMLLGRVLRRMSAYTLPRFFSWSSCCFASSCLSITLLFRGSDGNFPRISRLYKSWAGGILVVECGVDL